MNHLRLRLTIISLLTLCVPSICSAAELFSSPQQKAGFLKALSEQDAHYDLAEKMIRRPFSSPGYHTTLKDGYVHPPRDSLNYAVALLDSGEPARLKRAQDILRKVISLQDQDPNSRTYGIWSWFAEEPLEKMSPPDWNWADFCGTQLLQVAHDHMNRLPDELQQQVKDSIIHAAYSIKRRNVGPGYTNIAIMGTYVTLTAGELFGVDELTNYGKKRLKRFYDYTFEQGSFREYNSPTYTVVAIKELSRMLRHVKDPASQKLLRELNRFAWYHLARHFHPPSRQWAGPHSRCYATLLRDSTLAFIQRATNNRVIFLPEGEIFESLDAHRIDAECPEELFHYFTDLPSPRLEAETFSRNAPDKHDIIGTTYLHPDYTLGSVNIGDLWNQRRPLLAYWNTDTGPVAMRLRCLHDDYDYSSASILTVQDKSDVLGAVVFATDRGDTHISLDRLKNATIKAKDLRIRLQFEGAIDHLKLPSKTALNRTLRFSSGPVSCDFQIPHAVFGDYPIKTETGRDSNSAWLDVILYQGEEKDINFAEISDAAVIFALSIATQQKVRTSSIEHPVNTKHWAPGRTTATWHNMSLTIPTNPMKTSAQRAAASAEKNGQNLWKTETQ
ncbi:MAG TPA: hypothetical protein VMW72_09680 [Sedimentisphaerales bacterium]|nr:hypothetical protein [Sedimentisphaerales bacterium]